MLKKTYLLYAAGGALLLGLVCVAVFTRMASHDKRFTVYNPAFDAYLSAFTSGEISRKSDIVVQFAHDIVSRDAVGTDLSKSPFQFWPAISGKAVWRDTRTLVFQPETVLPSGKVYNATLAMAQVVPGISRELGSFHFQFGTRPQAAQVSLTQIRAVSNGDQTWQEVTGVIKTADYETPEQVEKILEANIPGKKLHVRWTHDDLSLVHTFTVDSLKRTDEAYTLKLKWKGDRADIRAEGEEVVEIPAAGVFKHLHTYSYAEPEPYAIVEFSDPVEANQDLNGLITLGDIPLRYTLDGNRVKLYPTRKVTGSAVLRIEAGILSEDGNPLLHPLQEAIAFEETKPEIRLIGKGVILPRSNSLPFVFEAVGLKAIDVRVIKIYEKNIPQFLQVNQLDENNELRRVGQLVVQKKIDLDPGKADLGTWNRHAIDLASLIQADPGAIYEVAIAFRRSYVIQGCDETETFEDRDVLALDGNWKTGAMEADNSFWDYYYEDYYDEIDDPCKRAFYNQSHIVRRNVLASDLGLISKRSDLGSWFAVTDLKTTLPVVGAKLDMYDYQHQLITTLTTDKNGEARIPGENTPYLLVASHNNQRGYLRLDDGSALSLSRFDTQGKTYVKGVKGFIYGERGVWRPGDQIYLTFILEDKGASLPAGHPVNFELVDPQGKVVDKQVRTEGLNGFFSFHTQTAADAVTGNYTARVRVGGAKFTQTIKVETIVPNRLKMELDFGSPYLVAKRTASGKLKAQWLTGLSAKGMESEVKVTLKPTTATFAGFSDYNFDDPVKEFNSEEKVLYKGKLNEYGEATITSNLSGLTGVVPGKLTANFVTRVFEPGGAFSIDRFSVPYYAYPVLAGVKTPKGDVARGMLLTDTDHTINIATVDPAGNPVSSTVEVALYKLSWAWWWEQSAGNVFSYEGTPNAELLSTATVTTVNGRGTWTLNVKYPDWGRYLIRLKDKNGHTAGKIIYMDWPGWAGRGQREDMGGAQMLSFSAEKELYNVGETVNLSIPTGAAGRALISIESGSRILQTHWIEAVKGTTRFSFKATPDMAPNIYVNISLLQPHAQTQNDLPIRMYGVIPLKVEDPATHLSPVISMPNELAPNSDYTVQVSEATGKAMTYTLAVVDEGLLGLTRYKAPDPWQTFYQREALDVKTWDLYDFVLGAYGGQLKSMLSIGGSDDPGGPEGRKADRFKPVVIFLGPFSLKPGQTASHAISIPNYVGSVRTMVVAGTPAGAYGATEKATPVKKALMVLGTLPRVLGPGERMQMPVSVFTTESALKDVTVSINASKQLLLDGPESQTIRFNQPGEKIITFQAGALSTLGKATVTFTARSGSETAVYQADIEIRNPNPRVYEVVAGTAGPTQTWTQAYKQPGMFGTNHGVLEVSALPPINLGRRLQYLIQYPYGCLEQTTSGAFPQLYLSTLMELTPQQKERTSQHIQAAIKRLRSFQLANGGFTYWPGQTANNDWGTSYAGHFLIEAEKAGYSLPAGMLDNWKKYQQEFARNWKMDAQTNLDAEIGQAYRLYLLALAGAPEVGAMNRLRQKSSLPYAVAWNLAAAYYLAGQQDVARKMVQTIPAEAQPLYGPNSYTYGSVLRDESVILQALSIMNMRDRATDLVKKISEKLSSDSWYSTHSTAFSLMAMARYVGDASVSKKVQFSYRINGGAWQEVNQNAPYWQVDFDPVAKGSVEVRNTQNTILFPRVITDGIPMQGDSTSASNGLAINIAYTTLEGTLINPVRIEQGTDVKISVNITNTSNRDYTNIALNQIFPSGWEIMNARMDDPTFVAAAGADYQDIRDDRVYTFFDLGAKKSVNFTIVINAAYLGRYYLPTTSAEAMYDKAINARTGGKWVQVVPSTQN
ncbi:MAG: MG2 domain-containing protein [Bacteroidia bacterium]|nr:MG2 domain-containing protein [Bacteroidia bacterium]